ncbi:hypothetical protein C8N40_109119 [Pontibacter mucosus]|uniref:Tetratricopeptide repeat protein n=1 Tax=Pontibacter mucosus TaxID=1649266 RepID=A0A2T5YE84_9BACT|nr:hypothetical protein C8N40_109119 [Pontibacter mucosus]
MVLGTWPANFYINYLIAVALAQQGRDQAAQPYLAKAIAGDPAQEQYYLREQEAIKQQKSTASAVPVSASEAEARTDAPALPLRLRLNGFNKWEVFMQVSVLVVLQGPFRKPLPPVPQISLNDVFVKGG